MFAGHGFVKHPTKHGGLLSPAHFFLPSGSISYHRAISDTPAETGGVSSGVSGRKSAFRSIFSWKNTKSSAFPPAFPPFQGVPLTPKLGPLLGRPQEILSWFSLTQWLMSYGGWASLDTMYHHLPIWIDWIVYHYIY
jgi:hypothetical protein